MRADDSDASGLAATLYRMKHPVTGVLPEEPLVGALAVRELRQQRLELRGQLQSALSGLSLRVRHIDERALTVKMTNGAGHDLRRPHAQQECHRRCDGSRVVGVNEAQRHERVSLVVAQLWLPLLPLSA